MIRQDLLDLYPVQRLDIGSAEDVRLYEEGFYRAFVRHSNPGIRAIWIWDDPAQRLRTSIPYEDQAVFFVRNEEGVIHTAVGLNLALNEFQSGAYGFEKPPLDHKWAEGLVLFNTGASRAALITLMWKVSRWVMAQGYESYYITSAERAARFHQKMGAELLDQSEALGVVRYFFRQKLCSMNF